MGLRAMYMYGVLLPPDAEGEHFHVGCCGFNVLGGSTGYIEPNTFVPLDRETEITPTLMILENLRFAIHPERAKGKRLRVGYEFTDTGETFTLTLRNSVLEVTPSLLDGSATLVRLTRAFGNRMLRGEKSLQSGMESGEITIHGNPAEVQALHSIFDRSEELPAPHTALR